MPETLTPKKLLIKILICTAALAVVMVICASIGTQDISFAEALRGHGETAVENINYEILVKVRLPRIILAAIVGAALACSGAALQAILRNPLAEPYILGISSGAGLGVIIAVISGVSWTFWAGSPMAVFAFIGALATVCLVWRIGRSTGRSQVTTLLLAGVVVNAFLSAVIMFLTSIANTNQLRTTIFWLMGNINVVNTQVLAVATVFILIGIIGLITIAQKLNVLTFGRHEAKTLGVNTAKTQVIAFGCAAFITAIAVSLSGLIGFVGLVVPHCVRLVFGPDHRQLLPLTAILGAAFLVIADTIARTILGQEQLPVGVITAITGGPFFLILLARYSRKVSWLK